METDKPVGDYNLNYTLNTSETDIQYYMSVTVDENKRIIDISRLSAEMLLSESERSSKWSPYSIDPEDYEFIAEDMINEAFSFVRENKEEE